MRNSRDSSILKLEDKFVGINLGADHVSEHEWGIKDICSRFGIDSFKLGLDARKITKTHSNLLWLPKFKSSTDYIRTPGKKKSEQVKKTWSGLFFDPNYDPNYDKEPYTNECGFYGELATAWDGGSFAVFAHEPEQIEQLKEVHSAFASNDIAIWRGGGGVFQNAGLVIAIASRLPAQVTDGWMQHDIEQKKLIEDFSATGIESKLRAADKRYFALSPRREAEGSLIFWLNPMEQNTNNAGWYKLEQLEQWIKNEGPIPKKK